MSNHRKNTGVQRLDKSPKAKANLDDISGEQIKTTGPGHPQDKRNKYNLQLD